jgi:hypothetical protein
MNHRLLSRLQSIVGGASRLGGIIGLGLLLGFGTRTASAQVYIVGGPVYPSAVVVQRPVVAAPVVIGSSYGTYSDGYTLGYAAYSPAVTSTYVAPAAYVAPAPVVTYRPVVPYTTYAVPYIAARPVVVRPKVYVPGQPIRNTIRAITP